MIFDDGCQTKFKVCSSGRPAPQGRGISGFSRGAGRRPCGGKVCRAARSARIDTGARRFAARHRRDRPHPASKRSPIGSACSQAGWSRSSTSCKRGSSSGESKTRATVVSTCCSSPRKGRRSFNPLGRVAREHQDALLAALTTDERALLASLLSRVADQQGLRPGVHPGFTRLRAETGRTSPASLR